MWALSLKNTWDSHVSGDSLEGLRKGCGITGHLSTDTQDNYRNPPVHARRGLKMHAYTCRYPGATVHIHVYDHLHNCQIAA